MKKLVILILLGAFLLAGCQRDAEVVSYNLAYEADNFNIDRRIVVFNGITDSYLLEVVGRCSIEDQEIQLEITCKIGPEEYKKHLAGLSDNVSYFVEQLETHNVSEYRYKVVFKPATIIPDVDPDLG